MTDNNTTTTTTSYNYTTYLVNKRQEFHEAIELTFIFKNLNNKTKDTQIKHFINLLRSMLSTPLNTEKRLHLFQYDLIKDDSILFIQTENEDTDSDKTILKISDIHNIKQLSKIYEHLQNLSKEYFSP